MAFPLGFVPFLPGYFELFLKNTVVLELAFEAPTGPLQLLFGGCRSPLRRRRIVESRHLRIARYSAQGAHDDGPDSYWSALTLADGRHYHGRERRRWELRQGATAVCQYVQHPASSRNTMVDERVP